MYLCLGLDLGKMDSENELTIPDFGEEFTKHFVLSSDEETHCGANLIDPFEHFQCLSPLDADKSCSPPSKRYRGSDGTKVSLPEVNIPDIQFPNESDCDTDCSESEASQWSIPSMTMDDPGISNMDAEKCATPKLNIEDGHVLYDGARLTSEQANYMLLSWFSSFPGVSKSAFSRLLYILHCFILPADNNLPSSYADLYKKIQAFLSPVKDYHCCINDCVVFRDSVAGEYSKLSQCPKCNEERYRQGTKIPQKRFKYIPLESRIRRLFADKKTSQLIQSHSLSSSNLRNNKIVDSIHCTEAWRALYSSTGFFQGDPRGLSFAICMDGLNPFSREKNSYSTCPILLVIVNLPQQIRMLSGSIVMTGLIPGPKEPKNTDAYVDVLIDDIMDLNTLTIYDGHADETFNLKANIVLNIFDYPGQNKVLHCQGAGAYSGCSYCCIRGEYSKALNKMVYLDHRSFLPVDDSLRLDHRNFPSVTVSDKPPAAKNMTFIKEKIDSINSSTTQQERKEITQNSGLLGDYSLRRLPFHDRYLNTPVEPMHLLKNISERLVKLLSGLTDTVKVRLDEKARKRFRGTWPRRGRQKDKRTTIPPAPFSFTKDQVAIANRRSLNVKAPSTMDWRPCKLFGKEASRLKSNEWKHVLTSGILKFCIRGLLGEQQESTLVETCDVVSLLCKDQVDIQSIDALEVRVHRVLSLLERDFPTCVHVISFHLLHHLPMFVRRFGPLHGFWMYPMERFNNWIKSRIQNRRYPESNVVETYRLYELGFHLQVTQQLPIGATVDIGTYLSTSDESEAEDITPDYSESHGQGYGSLAILDPNHVRDLNRLYMHTYRDYRDAVVQFEKSGTAEIVESQWSQELQSGPYSSKQCSITRYKVYTTKDTHGRSIKYGSTLSEHANSVHVSSYVHLKTSPNTFGRIQFIFEHKFGNVVHTLACVHWYDDSTIDVRSGLKQINVKTLNSMISSVVHMRDTSKPLVHAIDDVDEDKLWILNL